MMTWEEIRPRYEARESLAWRLFRLRQRGLSMETSQALFWIGPDAHPLLNGLERATDDELAQVSALYGTRNADGKHRKTDPNGVFTNSEWAPPTACRCQMTPTMCPTHPMKPRQEVSAMAEPRPVKLEVDTTSLDALRALTQSINEATTRLQEATQTALDMLTELQGPQEAATAVLCQVCGGSGLGPHNPDERYADDQCPTCIGTGMVEQIPAQEEAKLGLCPECRDGKRINCTHELEDGTRCRTWAEFLAGGPGPGAQA